MSDLDHWLRIDDEARAWLYELKTARDPEFSAFLRWLDESEDNLVAYLDVCREWAVVTGGISPPRYVRQADRLFFEGIAALVIACVADALWSWLWVAAKY